MARDLTSLATRYAGRPLLLTPRAAQELADRVRTVDHGSAVREGRFSALVRKLAGRDRRPSAMEDEDDGPDFGERAAYTPRYIGEAEDHGFCWSLKDGVALMNFEGPLLDRGEYFCGEIYHGYDTILAALREASADERVRGIFIRESTPGGVVAGGLPALAEWMRENGQRGGGKPIHVYADMACSAGYWMAASADRIVAPRVGLVGSIGAVIVHENWSKALDEIGVEITPIQFGAKKTDGAWWEALSDSAREDLQAEIDQCGRDFVADVIAGRPQLSADEVIATEARVFMGHHDAPERSALALKLVDAHASEETAFNELRDMVAAAPTKSSPASGTSSAEASRGRASATTAKEAPVAQKPKGASKAPTVAAARKAVARAQADLVRAESAEAAEDADPDAEDEDAVDETEASTEEDAESMDDGDEEGEARTEAQKIAGSPAASAHPALATAAIRDGLTLAQFKGQVAAATASGGRGQLQSTLGNAPRLGADAKGKQASAGLDTKAIYARRAQRGQPARA